jgi:hypothetical protein
MTARFVHLEQVYHVTHPPGEGRFVVFAEMIEWVAHLTIKTIEVCPDFYAKV